jgi:hypothetical protein
MSKRDQYPSPVPEKFQAKARMRRLDQQRRDGRISQDEYLESYRRVLADYKQRPNIADLPDE